MSKNTDLLLIQPGSRRIAYQSLADEACAVETPIWCGLIAGFVKQHGFSVEVLDANVECDSAADAAEKIVARKARLTAVVCYGQNPSASTQTMPAVIALTTATKKLAPDLRLAVLGGHVAALPERSLRETGADYACTGEGCHTLVDLLRGRQLEDCRGLAFEVANSIAGTPAYAMLTTKPAPNIADLDQDMPGVMWHMLPDPSKYRCHEWQAWATPEFGRSPYAALYTTLGCPFACHFCCIQAPFKGGDQPTVGTGDTPLGRIQLNQDDHGRWKPKNSYRYWSPELIGRQVATLYHDKGVRNFKVADEMFVLNRKHVLAVCEAIRCRIKNAHDRLNLWAYARVDTCNDDAVLTSLRSAGFRWLALGIESAVESVRDGVDKGYRQDKITACIARVNAAGLHVGANYIFGLPGDTRETMEATYALACELNTPYANFYCFPAGTPVWTPDGFKGIEKLQAGDKVYGKNGVTTVTCTDNRTADDLVEVKPRYLPPFSCTSEHPMWAAVISRDKHSNRATFRRFEWTAAGDLRPFDKQNKYAEYHALCINRNSFRREKTTLDLSGYVVGHLGAGKKGGQLNQVGQRYLEPWEVTEDLAELFGWYVAEGSIQSRINKQIGFALHRNEVEHQERIQYLLQSCLGLKSRVLQVGPNCVTVNFTSKVWLRAVHDLFGKDARTKRVPGCVMNASDAVVKAFLNGYCNGDGTSYPNSLGQLSATTASLMLGWQLTMLFLKTGTVPSCEITEARVGTVIGPKLRQIAPHYRLSWMDPTGHRKPHLRHIETCDWYFIPVKSVEPRYDIERVYNISTEDETYSMPWVTHNCHLPYPGAKVWDDYPDHHHLGWGAFAQFGYDCVPTKTETLGSAEVLEFREQAWQGYFKRQEYQNMMAETFGTYVATQAMKVGRPLKFKILEQHEPAGV